MPRIPRVVVPDFPHHVTQRGNFGVSVFDDDQSRRQYLKWLFEYAEQYGTKFWAYCLMSNHVHYIAVPKNVDSLARTFNYAHRRYSQHMNRKHGRVGHLWQGRFYSCVLDERHLYAAVRYIERNPVRGGMVRRAEEYPWSSAHAHVTETKDFLLSADCPLVETITDWSEYLSEVDEQDWAEEFRCHTCTGRPVGDQSFVAQIEAQLSRALKLSRAGRPRKKQQTSQK